MNIIDDIMCKIDWNASPEVQKSGIILSKSIKNLWHFVQPCTTKYNKNVWEGCAMILEQREDSELEPYIIPLLEWLQDANWPGFDRIFNRLKKFDERLLLNQYSYSIMRAIENKDNEWLNYLSGLIENKKIYNLLSSEQQLLMEEHYKNYWELQK